MKIISFCLYGKQQIYNKGAIYNAVMAKKVYPDFEVWIYISSPTDIDPQTYTKLSKMSNVKLINMNDTDISFGIMMWRYIPAFTESKLEIFITRDLDSCIDNRRDIYAVKDWIKSGTEFHIIKDHKCHYKYPIMGGIWGVKGTLLNQYKDFFNQFLQDCKFTNKDFTNKVISSKALRKASTLEKRGQTIDQYFLTPLLI